MRCTTILFVAALAGACHGSPAAGCNGNPGEGADAAESNTASSASASPALDEPVKVLREAEASRQVDRVTDDDLASRDLAVRRAAARTLARAQSPAARDGLLRLLSDEDEEVAAWAAYGLGDYCAGYREATVSALVAVAAARAPQAGSGRITAQRAIARAVGRCASAQSESTLAGWARRRDAHAVDAIHALGDVATQNKKLREETFVALLEVAAGNAANPPVPDALYPFGRVEHVPPSVVERALEVAKGRLKDKGPGRLYAVRTLGRCDDAAVPLLVDVLEKPKAYDRAERVEAARGLGRLGRKGQRALADALAKLVPKDGLSDKVLMSSEPGVLLAAMNAITDTGGGARATLAHIAALPPPKGASPAVARRVSWLRCTAAALVAERDFETPLLLACDLSIPEAKRTTHPLPGSIGARAVVQALGVDAVKLTGKRLQVWRTYVERGDLRSREAALEQLTEHDEVREAPELLAAALSAAESGLVGTAAQVIVKHPERARVETKKKETTVDARVKKALLAVLAKPATDLEALADVIEAVGALGLDGTKDRLLQLCSSPHAVLRDKSHAVLARQLGGASKVKCKPAATLPAPVELDHLASAPVKIELDTDVGKLSLTLEPEIAPVAVTRVADLVKSGFYNGMVVHRVVPAFVSQFGSPSSDGFGGAPGKPALPCETSPIGYRVGSVGVALAGRDTGGSQLFVTHVATPHLDGKYALLGSATGAWDALIDGDIIQKARLVE